MHKWQKSNKYSIKHRNVVPESEHENDLPKEQAKLLKLSYFYEKTHADISKELNIPLGTVKSRIRLALSKIRNVAEAV